MLVEDSSWISCWSHWNADLQWLFVSKSPGTKNWTWLGNHQTVRQESEKGRKNLKPLRFLTSEVEDLVIQDSGAPEESRSYTKHHQASRDKSSADAETSLSACWDVEIKGSTGGRSRTKNKNTMQPGNSHNGLKYHQLNHCNAQTKRQYCNMVQPKLLLSPLATHLY